MRIPSAQPSCVDCFRLFVCAAQLAITITGQAIASSPMQDAAQVRPSYAGEVHVATIAVTVTGPDGIPLDDLRLEEFEVLEEGRPRKTAFLWSPKDTALEVAVLLDTSASIGRRIPNIRELLVDFVGSLDSRDCVLMLPFSDSVGPGFWGVDIERFALDFALGGVTRLYDAIIAGLRALVGTADEVTPLLGNAHCQAPPDAATNRRRVLVLITDGDDTASSASFGEALVAAWEAGVPMIIMAADDAEALAELANVTSGRFIEADDRRRRSGVVRDMLATLRSVYLIGYYLEDVPTSGIPAQRSLEVRVRRAHVAAVSSDSIYVSGSRPEEAAGLADEARTSFEAGDIVRALELSQRATMAYWSMARAHYLRAVAALRLGRLDLAESSARWAVFLDPADPLARAFLEEIVAPMRDSANPPLERASSIELWVEPATHGSLPHHYVAAHVARIVASYIGTQADIRIARRPYDHGIAFGLSVRIEDLAEDGTIRGELALWSKQMERLDSKELELMGLEAQLSARGMPPQATEGLKTVIDPLLDRMRRSRGNAQLAGRQ